MFYPLTRFYDVEYDRPFLVLSILAATFTLAVLPRAMPPRRSSRARLELATNLLLRWAVLVAACWRSGYVTKFSEDYSRRVVVTWVLVTPVLLVMLCSCPAVDHARAAAWTPRTRAAPSSSGARRRAWSWRGASSLHIELGMSVAGFFDDRGSDRLGCAKHAQLLGRFGDVAAFVNNRNIDVIFIAIPPGQVARMRDLVNELGDTTASIYFVPDVTRLRHDPAAHQRDPRLAGGRDVRDAVPRLPRAGQAAHGRDDRRAGAGACWRRCC